MSLKQFQQSLNQNLEELNSRTGSQPTDTLMTQTSPRSQETGLNGLTKNTDGTMRQSLTLPVDSSVTLPDQTPRAPSRSTGSELSKPGVTAPLERPKPLYAPEKGLREVKRLATQAQSLIAQKKPSKCLTLNLTTPRTLSLTLIEPVFTPEQSAWLALHKRFCPETVAVEYLDWLSAHKRMENDQARMAVLKRDFAEVLSGCPEYAVALMTVWMIEEQPSGWWPVVEEVRSAVERFIIPTQALPAVTNASQFAKERFGEHIAAAWFSQAVIDGRTLYTASSFVGDWIRNNYLARMTDKVDEVLTVEVMK